MNKQSPLTRGAGVLCPVFSLPSPYGIGDLGGDAYRFVDFLASAGQKYWQVLPLGPTGFGNSPYQNACAFAGNPYLISPAALIHRGVLREDEVPVTEDGSRIDYAALYRTRIPMLHTAYSRTNIREDETFHCFCREHAFWLEDYARFMVIKTDMGGTAWMEWEDDGLRTCAPDAVETYLAGREEDLDFWRFVQYEFFYEWQSLRAYAGSRGVQIIGDIPIYVALDSSDVWAHSAWFQLDERRRPTHVAGVPPDMFSAVGQLWGNPLYDWARMEADGFSWWRQRAAVCGQLFDGLRIDHFIGIVRYYAIPYPATDARTGQWMSGPGEGLISAIMDATDIKFIAEDLGLVTEDVRALLAACGFPGMRLLQFAFTGAPDNENLPCHYPKNCVAYGGTHDNETMTGYFAHTTPEELHYAAQYLDAEPEEISRKLIRAGYASSADVVIFQLQDYLGIGNEGRINTPSTLSGNWSWRFGRGVLTSGLAQDLARMAWLYGR